MQNNNDISSIKIRKPLILLPDFSAVTEPKAEILEDFLKKINAEGRVLIIADSKDVHRLKQAAETLSNVKVLSIKEVMSKDMLEADCIAAAESAVSEASERLSE